MPFQRPALIDAYKRVSKAIQELHNAWSVFYARMSADALHYYLSTDGAEERFSDSSLAAWFEGYCDENGIVIDDAYEDYTPRKLHPDDLIIHREDFNKVLSMLTELANITQKDGYDERVC